MTTQVRLAAGSLAADFLPEQGMLGASLMDDGAQLLGLVDDVPAMAGLGRTCGIPLLYPWANRLSSTHYEAAGRHVALDSALLSHDDAGLFNHGVPWPHLPWTVLSQSAASVAAQLEWQAEELLAVFPYRHRLVMDVALDPDGLTITTTVHADAGDDVPISFGFHPFFELPGVARGDWQVELPAMTALLTDAAMIPDGRRQAAPAISGTFGNRTFDDGFELIAPDAAFVLVGGDRRVTVRFAAGYTHAQLFAPPGGDFIAIEPMTAPVNALTTGDGLRIASAGSTFSATFRIEVA